MNEKEMQHEACLDVRNDSLLPIDAFSVLSTEGGRQETQSGQQEFECNPHSVKAPPSSTSGHSYQRRHESHRRKGSNASTVSFTPSLFDVDDCKFLGRDHRDHQQDWSVNLGCQNLASVLNDPSIPRSYQETLFTKDWGYSFIEVPVEVDPVSVTRKELNFMRQYLHDVRKRTKKQLKLLQQIPSSVSMIQPRLIPRPDQNLERIPDLFLRKDFDLSNADIFNAVIAFSNSIPSNEPTIIFKEKAPEEGQSRKDLKTKISSTGLMKESLSPSSSSSSCVSLSSNSVGLSQRNLSDILDLVEDNLAHQIALRFRDFFHIMNAMDVLMEQVSRTIKEVTSVRGKCLVLQTSLVHPCLREVLLTRIRSNCQTCLQKLKLMNSLYQSNSKINGLLSSKDYLSALSLISRSKKDMENHLPGVKCFRHLSSELTEREKLIEKFLEEDFNKMLTQEFLQPFHAGFLDSGSESSASSRRESDSSISCSNKVLLEDEESLSCLVSGMIRVGIFNFVKVFFEEAKAAVITVKKQTVIQALSKEDIDVDNRNEEALHQQLKGLELKKWLAVLRETLANLTTLLTRVSAVNTIINRTLHQTAKNEGDAGINICLDSKSLLKWTKESNSSLITLCHFAEEETVFLIESRVKDSNDRMTSNDFKVFSQSIQDFVSSCRSFTQDSSPSTLKAVLSTQGNRFATRFHEEKKKKVTSLLDIEQWKSMEAVPVDLHSCLEQIVEGKWSVSSLQSPSNYISSNGSLSNKISKPTVTASASNKNKKSSSSSASFVELSGEKIVIVNSVVLCVSLMTEYIVTANEIPVLTADLLTRFIDLVKHFNGRSMKLVLMGEAKQVSGLKSVTSRVLINCSRAVYFLSRLLPYFKKQFDLLLTVNGASTGQKELLLGLFDETITSLREHIDKINDKLLNSCRDFMTAKLSKWEAKPPVPSPVFQSITQHLSLLQDNIEDILPDRELSLLFKKIDAIFKEVLREQINRLAIPNDGGPLHGLVTQELMFYAQSMNHKSIGKVFKFRVDDFYVSHD